MDRIEGRLTGAVVLDMIIFGVLGTGAAKRKIVDRRGRN